jgi:hypothetical protein
MCFVPQPTLRPHRDQQVKRLEVLNRNHGVQCGPGVRRRKTEEEREVGGAVGIYTFPVAEGKRGSGVTSFDLKREGT